MILRKKRFWSDVETASVPGGYTVLLDGKALLTPDRAAFAVPGAAMAERIAGEWRALEGEIDPSIMPFTRLANSAIDKVGRNRADIALLLCDYGGTDLVCYRAEKPAALVARQASAWDPLLDWLEESHGARLLAVSGVMFRAQNENDLRVLRAHLDGLDDFTLAGLHDLVVLSGSLVIGLAVLVRHLTAGQAWQASRIDEAWQTEQWGEDREAAASGEAKWQDFVVAAQYLDCLEP